MLTTPPWLLASRGRANTSESEVTWPVILLCSPVRAPTPAHKSPSVVVHLRPCRRRHKLHKHPRGTYIKDIPRRS